MTYPAPTNPTAPAYITLSGSGVTALPGRGEYAVSLSLSGTDEVSVLASVVDIAANAVSPQPSVTATSSNGAQQSGGSSITTTYPQSCGAGSQEEINGLHCDFSPSGYNIQPYVAGDAPTSLVATVSSVVAGVATITAINIRQSLVTFREPISGVVGNLAIQVVQ
jgi:hypothetical protein